MTYDLLWHCCMKSYFESHIFFKSLYGILSSIVSVAPTNFALMLLLNCQHTVVCVLLFVDLGSLAGRNNSNMSTYLVMVPYNFLCSPLCFPALFLSPNLRSNSHPFPFTYIPPVNTFHCPLSSQFISFYYPFHCPIPCLP